MSDTSNLAYGRMAALQDAAHVPGVDRNRLAQLIRGTIPAPHAAGAAPPLEERSQQSQARRLAATLLQQGLRGEQLLRRVEQLLGLRGRYLAALYLQQLAGLPSGTSPRGGPR